jgi:hypothetical protein
MNVKKLIPTQKDALFSHGSRSLLVNPLGRKGKALQVWTLEFHHINHLVLKEDDTTAVAMCWSFSRVISALLLLLYLKILSIKPITTISWSPMTTKEL